MRAKSGDWNGSVLGDANGLDAGNFAGTVVEALALTLPAGAAALLAVPLKALPRKPDWRALAEDVRVEMRWAWNEYRRRAWGKDQIKPISGGSESFPLKNHHLGLSLIEALDTLWVMG